MAIGKNVPVLILGSGIAGLTAAIELADRGYRVTLVAKDQLSEGATRYAQGGIASVWSQQDSFEAHVDDTLTAGAGLCRKPIVDICVREGPARIQSLIDLGVQFTKEADSQAYDLHQEGGHHQRRILHAADLTGWEIERALLAQVRKRAERIRIVEYGTAVDLITTQKIKPRAPQLEGPNRVLGAYVLVKATGQIETFEAAATLLATGGAGKVYLYTSNPDTATGDGIAMASRAGARIANLEFMQFHPTCLFHPEARTFLISEALRGEGAKLKTLDGVEFMTRYHEMGALAPRDIVARAIDREMKRTGDRHVWLDATHLPEAKLREQFPNIFETCLKFGIHLSQQPIPVVPACHYTCGGVLVDEHAHSSLAGLYAVGEVACTGLHGANRLASNSLLEATVFAHRAVENIHQTLSAADHPRWRPTEMTPPAWDSGRAVPIEDLIDIAATWREVRELMWNYVGIVRSNARLERARRRLQLIQSEIHEAYWDFVLTKDLIELRNLVTVAELIVECAIARKESRGLHYNVDHPERDDLNFDRDTIL